VEAMSIIWSLWMCRNNEVFNDKNYDLLQVITSLGDGALRLIYGGLYTVGATAKDTFFPTWVAA
jgi:hypothetical protein